MNEVRFVAEVYYDIQEMRIAADNRLRTMATEGLPIDRAKFLQDHIDIRLKDIEKFIKSQVKFSLEGILIWENSLKHVHGIGPILAACLISWIDPIDRFRTVSALWKYCGQHLDPETGRAPKPQKGKKIDWNPKLKVVCWKVGESFIKKKNGCQYAPLYFTQKVYYRKKFPYPIDTGKKSKKGKPIIDFTDGHIHYMARRYMVKRFLSHLWVEWRKLEGLDVREPYAVEKLGHKYQGPKELGIIVNP